MTEPDNFYLQQDEPMRSRLVTGGIKKSNGRMFIRILQR
jgi:hypothetical protein